MLTRVLGVALVFIALPAAAGDFSYNYIEGGYSRFEIDDVLPGVNADGDGLGIRGSVDLANGVYLTGGYAKADFDFGVDFDQVDLGVGYHVELSPAADFFATLSYVRAEASVAGFGSADEDGIGIEIGVRGKMNERIELEGRLGYVDLGDGGDGTSFGGAALYEFNETFALGATLDLDEDLTAYGIVGRVYFGR